VDACAWHLALCGRVDGLRATCFDLYPHQVSTVFATIVIAIIPAANFSRLLVPVSSLSGGGRLFGLGFPSTWYQPISVGTLTKALGLDDLWLNLMMLAIFFVLYLVAAKLILRKQET